MKGCKFTNYTTSVLVFVLFMTVHLGVSFYIVSAFCQ